jgi:hypothetical protein
VDSSTGPHEHLSSDHTDRALISLMRAIGDGSATSVAPSLATTPELATARLGGGGTKAAASEFFLRERLLQIYAGDTALHVAAAAYDVAVARELVGAGADIRARNRRGAEPLHAATTGGPGSEVWDPRRQAAIVRYLLGAGADLEATAAGGVTPLHRAVRNRCTAAVRVLLEAGADPHRQNDSGSTAVDLAQVTSGRGGTGTPEAKVEQSKIVALLDQYS